MLEISKQLTLPLSVIEKENSVSSEKLLELFVEKDNEILSLRKSIEELKDKAKEQKEIHEKEVNKLNARIYELENTITWQFNKIYSLQNGIYGYELENANTKLRTEISELKEKLQEAKENADYWLEEHDKLLWDKNADIEYLKDKIEELEIENEFFNEEVNSLLLETNDMAVNDKENDNRLSEYEELEFSNLNFI